MRSLCTLALLIFACTKCFGGHHVSNYNRLINSRLCNVFRPQVHSPVFDSGENLSQEGCGVWKEAFSESPPWAASIVNGDGKSACSGTLIARNIILSEGCNEDYIYFRRDGPQNYYACIGECFLRRADSACVNGKHGHTRQILDVYQFKYDTFSRPLHLWYIEEVPGEEVTPICLFNRDAHRDMDSTQVYTASIYHKDHNRSAQIVSTKECLDDVIYQRECDHVRKSICVYLEGESKKDVVLYNNFKNRYYLRGVYHYGRYNRKPDYILFFDLLYLIKEIVANSNGTLYVMPAVPEVKPKLRFNTEMGLSYPDCGRRLQEYVPAALFSVGGTPLAKEEAPWHATISISSDENPLKISCGGSLITPLVVLTAAHCVLSSHGEKLAAESFLVHVGMINRLQPNDSTVQSKYPAQIVAHPMYNKPTKRFENDVALMIFRDPFHVGSYVRPICLWNDDYHLGTIVNKTGLLAGYGFDETREQPTLLQGILLTVRSYWDCYLTNKPFFSKYMLPGQTFCAGMDGKTACNGDSGGGFAMFRRGRWFIRGLVSFGVIGKDKGNEYRPPLCDPLYPSLYTDIATHMTWIVSNVPVSKASYHKFKAETESLEDSGPQIAFPVYPG